MVKIIYKIEELLYLRHHKKTNLDEKLSEMLLASNNTPYRKTHTYIHKRSSKYHIFSKCNCLEGHSPYFMKENNLPEKLIYGHSRSKRLSPHIYCHSLASISHNEKTNYYGNYFKYPLFSMQQFPPGSKIIRIEPGTPLPIGAIPIPFRFEDSQNGPSGSHYPYRPYQLKQQHAQLSEPKMSNTSRKYVQPLNNKTNIPVEDKARIFPIMKDISLNSIPNPYSVTGFFPEAQKSALNCPSDLVTDNLNNYGPNIPTSSQDSITDTDNSTTIGSSCDSFNIQIQISAPH